MAEVRAALEGFSEKPAEAQPSVAVLPFANMSREADDEYFSDGLAEEIINALTQVSGLKVIARTSAFAFKGKNANILGAAAILLGIEASSLGRKKAQRADVRPGRRATSRQMLTPQRGIRQRLLTPAGHGC